MDNFVGEIRIFAGNYAPVGWAFCDGTLLQINDNQLLYSLIGTQYGGDGKSTFGLPDLRGTLAVSAGQGTGLTGAYPFAQRGGAPTVTLSEATIPAHVHAQMASATNGSTASPALAVYAALVAPAIGYVNSTATGVRQFSMSQTALDPAGSGGDHPNVMPVFAVSYIIALNGLYPQFP